MINKFLKLFIIFISGIVLTANVQAEVIKAGVSLTEKVPVMFFGTWRVSSTLIDTNSPANFKKKNVDIWNLSKEGDVINLRNPFSGASASIMLSYAGQDAIRFTKTNNYEGRVLTDTVELYIDGEKFSGVNTITLDTLSNVDNKVIKTAKATYTLEGEKIAGMSISGR